MTKEFEGKVALVTGGLKGLGRSIVLSLAKRGAMILINDIIDDSELECKLVEEVKLAGGMAITYTANVKEHYQVREMFSFLKQSWGRLDILINNAGISRTQTIFETQESDWDDVLDINLKSGFLCSKAAIELMKETGGKIVFISSTVAHQGALYGHVHYATSKAGQLGMMRTLARTGAQWNINVNAVAPGIIETNLLKEIHGDQKIKELTKSIPLGIGRSEDVGESVAFLCSEGARYITGEVLNVNGGLYMN